MTSEVDAELKKLKDYKKKYPKSLPPSVKPADFKKFTDKVDEYVKNLEQFAEYSAKAVNRAAYEAKKRELDSLRYDINSAVGNQKVYLNAAKKILIDVTRDAGAVTSGLSKKPSKEEQALETLVTEIYVDVTQTTNGLKPADPVP